MWPGPAARIGTRLSIYSPRGGWEEQEGERRGHFPGQLSSRASWKSPSWHRRQQPATEGRKSGHPRGSPCASEKLGWAPSGAATARPGLCVHGSGGGSGFGQGREPSLRGPGVGGPGCGLRGGCGHAARWESACSEQNPQCLGFLAEGPPRKKQCAHGRTAEARSLPCRRVCPYTAAKWRT